MKTNKVLIVGAGAIGAFYGALLAKTGTEVAVVCRSDYDYVKRHGFNISSRLLGDWHFQPARVLSAVSDYQDEADYLLLSTKLTPDIDLPELIRPGVGSRTAVVFIQNGVEIEQTLFQDFPNNEVVSGLAFICSNRTQPGQILHLAYGRLMLGNLPSGVSTKTQRLCALFTRAGIECHAEQNIITARWQKCVWNAPFNPLSVLSGGLTTKALLDTQEPLVRAIMQEVCDIAQATGHPLPEDIIEQNIGNTHKMPPYKTSMLLDYEQGHAMETEAILGNAVRAARREGVACPHLDTLYALMKLRELQLANSV